MKRTDKKKVILYFFITAFITNLIWENFQAPLYAGFKTFGQHFLFCLVASVVDAVVILAFYFIIRLMRKDPLWLLHMKLGDMFILLFMGLFTAILFEKWALKSGSWDYASEMPLIFGIGLAPLIQLSILSIISVYIVKFVFRGRVA